MTERVEAPRPTAADGRDEALCELDVAALLHGYRAQDFTPLQVAQAYLRRIDRLNPRLHGYILVFTDRLLQQARDATRRYQEGLARPLEGIPVGIKDLIDVAGCRTTAGSATRAAHVASHSATLVDRLEHAGAILLGKQQTAEFAFGSWGDNEHLGTPWNPWRMDVHHVPGGSSSGAAIAVAGRLAPVSIGTDTGGSVRVPASFNGIVGFKPTAGRISGHGIVALSPTLDSPGILSRSVVDAALLYDVLQGHDDHDARTWNLPQSESSVETLRRAENKPLSGVRLACLSLQDRVGIDAEVLAAYDRSLALLQSAGAQVSVVEWSLPLATYGETAPMAAESYALYGTWAEDPTSPMDSRVRARVLGGKISAAEHLQGLESARQQRVEFYRRLQGHQALIMPTTQTAAIPVADINARPPATILTRFVNLFGLCAVAVPSGYNTAGLPMSVQIVGRGFDEPTVLRLARALELLTGDERHYPVL